MLPPEIPKSPQPQVSAASPASLSCSSPAGSPTSRGFAPPKTWASMVTKDKEAEALAMASGRHASSSSTKDASKPDEAKVVRKDTIIDYLLFMSRYKADGQGSDRNVPPDLPEELKVAEKKFHSLLESGVSNIGKARFT